MQKLVLMNRTHEVCVVNYDDRVHAITGVDELCDDVDHGPVGIVDSQTLATDRLSAWWGSRAIPLSRPHLTSNLAALGLVTPLELPEHNHGLSLSDQYWLKAPGSNLCWDDINYFHNDFDDTTGRLLFSNFAGQQTFGALTLASKQSIELNIPDNTSDGILPKRWSIKDGERCLIKGGGFLNQEPYNEVIATQLYERLLQTDDFVRYALIEDGGRTCSICPNMLASDEEFVPATYLDALLPYKDGEDAYRHYIRCCQTVGVNIESNLAKMLICDYILANHDRHYRNFGLIRNVDTLTWRAAPLFDSGSSLWCNVRTLRLDSLGYDAHPFIADPLLQLGLVERYDWFDPEKLANFSIQMITILKDGPLHDYGMRLITIEDTVDERIDRLVDRVASKIL